MLGMTASEPADHESDVSVNSGSGVGSGEDVIVERPDDEDHDLLTFGEAGARLSEEVIKQQRIIERLREGDASNEILAAAQGRLDALERARARNSPPSLDDLKSSGFFGRR
jgi:hypothetical protein